MDLNQLIAALDQQLPGIAAEIARLAPEEQQILLQVFMEAESQAPGSGVGATLDFLLGALVDPQGGAGGPVPLPPGADPGGAAPLPPGAPPDLPAPPLPGPLPPGAGGPPPEAGAMPPGLPPELAAMLSGAGMPPPGGVPPEMQQGQPTQAPEPGRQIKPQPKAPEVPKYKLPDLAETRWADEQPTLRRIEQDAKLGRDRWKARDQRIEDDLCCYRGDMPVLGFEGQELRETDGARRYSRSTPFNWVKRVSALATWTNDRVEMDKPARAETYEHKEAAQRVEDWQRTMRLCDEDRWFGRASEGDPQPPLPATEAEMMALLGGLGWQWKVDPSSREYPFCYEPVPVNQLYPLAHATTRQFCLPLNEARAAYREIDEYYPIEDDDGREWGEDLEVRITCWSDKDGYRHAIIWEEEGGGYGNWPERSDGERDRWIKKPKDRLDLGFPVYNLRIWSSVPSGPTPRTKSQFEEFVGMGVLTRVRAHFQFVDMLAAAMIQGAMRAVDPSTLQTHQQGTNLDDVDPIDLSPGARNFGFQGDDVKILMPQFSATPDGSGTIQMIINEAADIMPPGLSGGEVGNSGFQQMQASEVASATTVGPLIDALERTYQTIFKQRTMLALRFAKNKKNKDREYFSDYSYRSFGEKANGFYGTMKPADIELAGVEYEVRYKRLSLTEEAALANMVVQLTNAHLMSVDTALKRLGVKAPEREWLKILEDGAMLDPNVLKGLVGTAITLSGNPILIEQWNQANMLSALGGGGGSPPAPAGSPSAPNPAGVAAPRQPADVQSPGASSPVAA